MIHNLLDAVKTQMSIIPTLFSVAIGTVAGVFASIVVNAALIEISLSAFFSLVFDSLISHNNYIPFSTMAQYS